MKVYELIEVSYFPDAFVTRTCKETIGIYSTEEKAKAKIKDIEKNKCEYRIKQHELDK